MNYRALLIRLVTFLGGLYFFLKFVLPKEFTLGGVPVNLSSYNEQASAALTAMFSMALGLGLVNLLLVHGGAIMFLRRGWAYSSALLAGLAVMLVLSVMNWSESLRISGQSKEFFVLGDFALRIESDARAAAPNVLPAHVRQRILRDAGDKELRRMETAAAEAGGRSAPYEAGELRAALTEARGLLARLEVSEASSPEFAVNKELAAAFSNVGGKTRLFLTAFYERSTLKRVYQLFFNGVFVALGSAMFSLLGFYIASAAYRAFRVKSIESALMMGAALLVVLGQVPFALFGHGETGAYVQSLLPKIRLWLLTVPNSAAFRAIELGAAVAALVMAFRMWLSIESRSFAEKEKR